MSQSSLTMSNIGNMSPMLEGTYSAYIDAINARDWPLVASFVSEAGVTHNNIKYTGAQYAHMIDITSAPYRGITFVPERIICTSSDGHSGDLFCRIRFEYDDQEPFFEHACYEFVRDKILSVHSIIQDRKPS